MISISHTEKTRKKKEKQARERTQKDQFWQLTFFLCVAVCVCVSLELSDFWLFSPAFFRFCFFPSKTGMGDRRNINLAKREQINVATTEDHPKSNVIDVTSLIYSTFSFNISSKSISKCLHTHTVPENNLKIEKRRDSKKGRSGWKEPPISPCPEKKTGAECAKEKNLESKKWPIFHHQYRTDRRVANFFWLLGLFERKKGRRIIRVKIELIRQ